MTERIDFASKPAADAWRDEHEEHLCSDDDRRLKTVAIASSAPDRLVEEAAIESAVTRAERDGVGQAPLTDHEKDSIDFSAERASVPWARSIKAIMQAEGVDDWLAYLDPTLSVDEHRDVATRAARDEHGDRLDAEDSVDDKLASVEGAQDEQCGQATDYCEDGDDDACEFLQEACGFDEEDVEDLVSAAAGDQPPGELYGAKNLLWRRYQIAIAEAKEAAAAINEISTLLGESPTAFRELGDRELTKEDIDW